MAIHSIASIAPTATTKPITVAPITKHKSPGKLHRLKVIAAKKHVFVKIPLVHGPIHFIKPLIKHFDVKLNFKAISYSGKKAGPEAVTKVDKGLSGPPPKKIKSLTNPIIHPIKVFKSVKLDFNAKTKKALPTTVTKSTHKFVKEIEILFKKKIIFDVHKHKVFWLVHHFDPLIKPFNDKAIFIIKLIKPKIRRVPSSHKLSEILRSKKIICNVLTCKHKKKSKKHFKSKRIYASPSHCGSAKCCNSRKCCESASTCESTTSCESPTSCESTTSCESITSCESSSTSSSSCESTSSSESSSTSSSSESTTSCESTPSSESTSSSSSESEKCCKPVKPYKAGKYIKLVK